MKFSTVLTIVTTALASPLFPRQDPTSTAAKLDVIFKDFGNNEHSLNATDAFDKAIDITGVNGSDIPPDSDKLPALIENVNKGYISLSSAFSTLISSLTSIDTSSPSVITESNLVDYSQLTKQLSFWSSGIFKLVSVFQDSLPEQAKSGVKMNMDEALSKVHAVFQSPVDFLAGAKAEVDVSAYIAVVHTLATDLAGWRSLNVGVDMDDLGKKLGQRYGF